MNINLVLIKLADMTEAGYITGKSPTGGTLDPGHSSMGMVHQVEGRDPGLNDRIGMTPEQRYAPGSAPAGDGVLDNMKDFFSTPHGQVAAAAGLLGLGALGHHMFTKRSPRNED